MKALPTRGQGEWWWFPFALVGALLGVVAVNGVMVYDAVSTFPGEAGQDGFDLSNAYDRVLAIAAEQAALGWHIGIEADGGRHAVLQATDSAGLGLEHATVAAQAERPLGP